MTTRRARITVSRVRIAHVATVDLSLRFLLLNQLRSLRDAGYDVTGISADGPHVAGLHGRGIRHVPVAMTRSITPIADLKAFWRLYRLFRRERYTIVHCHTPKAELLGQLAARLAGVPIVVDTFRGLAAGASAGRLRRWWLSAFARLAASCADQVLCQSRELMDDAIRSRVCSADRIGPLGNGIDLRQYDPLSVDVRDVRAVRHELGLSATQPVIGFVGRLVREKGVLDLFQAMRRVRDRVPGAQLLVVGPVDREKADVVLPQMARDFGVASACTFAGMRTDMPTLYALMNLFVLPSHRESFPRAPMEASAMGVPCIVSDIDGCREVVEHGRNGWLVPPGDVQALSDAIVTLLTRRDLAAEMGRAGRRRAVDCFDEERVFEIVKATYVRLLTEKGLGLPRAETRRAGAGRGLGTSIAQPGGL